MNELTPRQVECAKFINQFIVENDNFPTVSQISNALGIAGSSAFRFIATLYDKGWIKQLKTSSAYKRTDKMKQRMAQL